MPDICGDNRFEIVAEYKKKLIEGTNIESCPEEMAVIDSILFRFWQMGWLKDQEARVMTLQEAIDYGYDYGESGEDCNFPPVFIEYFDDRKCYVHWWVAGQVNMNLYQTVTLREDYNKPTPEGFRLWTARPTPEQMRDTPWEGDSDD